MSIHTVLVKYKIVKWNTAKISITYFHKYDVGGMMLVSKFMLEIFLTFLTFIAKVKVSLSIIKFVLFSYDSIYFAFNRKYKM